MFEKITGSLCSNKPAKGEAWQAFSAAADLLPANFFCLQHDSDMNTLYTFLILNGPNLGHLGVRQPEIYGSQGLDSVPVIMRRLMGDQADAVNLVFFQTNSEGGLIDRLEQARQDGVHGVVLNAGAYTHTSLALADCLAWLGLPVVEVHISNILARTERIRHTSLIAPHVIGLIAGFGISGYALGVQALHAHCSAQAPIVKTVTA